MPGVESLYKSITYIPVTFLLLYLLLEYRRIGIHPFYWLYNFAKYVSC